MIASGFNTGHGTDGVKSRLAKDCHPWLARLPRDRHGRRECSRIVWNNSCLVADGLNLALPIPSPGFVDCIDILNTRHCEQSVAIS